MCVLEAKLSFNSDLPLQSNQLPISVEFPREQESFIEVLTLLYKRIADSVNKKEGSLYLLQELANFQQFFVQNDPQRIRNGYRRVFILDPATLTFNHNITGITQITNYWAIANTATGFRKVPFVDTTNVTNQISMRVTTTQVIIVNGATAPAITGGIVVLEYLKT